MSTTLPLDVDGIVIAVLETFERLPRKSKPRPAEHGFKEWVPLAGLALVGLRDEPVCVALATGMKCLPLEKVVAADGRVLHDSHAEVLALRAFNLFLLNECLNLAQGDTSEVVVKAEAKFKIKDDLKICMYCSEAPCGDASMELIMDAQEDARPWTVPVSENGTTLHGRGYFSQLGVVRRKPARPDAPIANSKSCSDKLALKEGVSLLQSATACLFDPESVYLHALIIPKDRLSQTACSRAFGPEGRLLPLVGRMYEAGYAYRPFCIFPTEREFLYARNSPRAGTSIPSNVCSFWTPFTQETIINGIVQGKRTTDRTAPSALSKRRMFETLHDLTGHLGECGLEHNYADFKASSRLTSHNAMKEKMRETLQGWNRNPDNSFEIENTT